MLNALVEKLIVSCQSIPRKNFR